MAAPTATTTATRARPGTYSIVARDAATGELGVAVQSHWFSVGPIVPWARTGVGAVATQANAEVSYGPRALDLLEPGDDAPSVLQRLLAEDPAAQSRQVGVVDAQGRVAVHTGNECIPFAGHVAGEGVCCQANIMGSESVWPAMLAAYEGSDGRLAERLVAALEAAEREGGDIRGRQSAAILIVPASGERWESRLALRVEDHPDPLAELRRLLQLHDAYIVAGEADALVGLGRHDEAAALYRRAVELAPESHELQFWAGLGAAAAGDLDEALVRVRRAIEIQPGWRELLPRIPDDVAPSAKLVLERL